MPEIAKLALFAMAFLLIKHTIADFFLQTAYQYKNKGRYGHPGGLLHSLIHITMTAPVFIILPVSWTLAGAVLSSEFVLHYHIDWAKEQITESSGWTPAVARFWNALGVDQLLHGLTYVTIIAALIFYLSM